MTKALQYAPLKKAKGPSLRQIFLEKDTKIRDEITAGFKYHVKPWMVLRMVC